MKWNVMNQDFSDYRIHSSFWTFHSVVWKGRLPWLKLQPHSREGPPSFLPWQHCARGFWEVELWKMHISHQYNSLLWAGAVVTARCAGSSDISRGLGWLPGGLSLAGDTPWCPCGLPFTPRTKFRRLASEKSDLTTCKERCSLELRKKKMNQRTEFLQDPCFTPGKKCELIKARLGNRMSLWLREFRAGYECASHQTWWVLCSLRRLAFQIRLILWRSCCTRGSGVENVKDSPLDPQRIRLYFV